MAKKTVSKNVHYVPSGELEEWWTGWLLCNDTYAWEMLSDRIYRICQGIVVKFNPKDPEESFEHVHDAFLACMCKIRNGKLKFTKGRAPVFNLVTTTIFRILFSKMNKLKRQRLNHKKYVHNMLMKHMPELLRAYEHGEMLPNQHEETQH